MSAAHTLRVCFTPGVHISRAEKDAISARLGGVRVRRHLWADFITVTRCRRGLAAAAGLLHGTPHVVAIEEESQQVALGQNWAARIRAARTLLDLDCMVPELRLLPEAERVVLRPLWLARRAQLREQVAELKAQRRLRLA